MGFAIITYSWQWKVFVVKFTTTLLVILLTHSLLFPQTEKVLVPTVPVPIVKTDADILCGAERPDKYLPHLQGLKVGVVANHTAMVGNKHLVDVLIEKGIEVKKVFAPEHGFRGSADAGERITDGKDEKTGLPIISLYGKNKKPSAEMLADIDVIIFDIQDVGVRFYTYISTMTYVMEACAESNKTFIVLDRPNPNGYFVDGPLLVEEQKSFIGMHPVPLVHGLTVAEFAQMINNEKWLKDNKQCNLILIPCKNYSHRDLYQLPIKPSPNLPNMASVYLYPSLGLFEGTALSIGRGTDKPFQIVGHPSLKDAPYTFTPKSTDGAKNPKLKGEKCKGFDLENFGSTYIRSYKQVYLYWLINLYNEFPNKDDFWRSSFNLLAGTSKLKEQIIAGTKEEDIRKSWQNDLTIYKEMRRKYLMYPDYE